MRKLTAAERRGMQFCESGDNTWTSVNNAYTITRTVPTGFVVRDGVGRHVALADTFRKATKAARDHLRSI
jgi:hypothetical protein